MSFPVDFIEACRKMIAIDSSPVNGTLEVAQFAASLASQMGMAVELQHETHHGLEQANVIVRPIRLLPDRELLLQTHLDTVDPGPFGMWTKTGANPYNASIYQDAIYGLGAAEVKLDFLCKLWSLQNLKERSWRLPPVLVGTFGEELGMPGAIKLIRKKKVNAHMALVGEPTEMQLVIAAKGLAAVEIDIPFSDDELVFRETHNQSESASTQSKMFMGKAAHSSMPEHGESAILKMLDFLSKLPSGISVMELEGGMNFNTVPSSAVLEFVVAGNIIDGMNVKVAKISATLDDLQSEFLQHADSSFDPPNPNLNIGLIRTYETGVKMSGCCRVPPSVTTEVYEGWMRRLRTTCESVGAEFKITDYKQPFRTSKHSELVKQCQAELAAMNLPTACGALPASNEANVLSRFGIECVVIGPGRSVGNTHTPDEHVKIQGLNDAIRFYSGVMERICL